MNFDYRKYLLVESPFLRFIYIIAAEWIFPAEKFKIVNIGLAAKTRKEKKKRPKCFFLGGGQRKSFYSTLVTTIFKI